MCTLARMELAQYLRIMILAAGMIKCIVIDVRNQKDFAIKISSNADKRHKRFQNSLDILPLQAKANYFY